MKHLIPIIVLFLIFLKPDLFAQRNFRFFIDKTDFECGKASATVNISDLVSNDTVNILWSNGQIGYSLINSLDAGDYYVNVKIGLAFDTTLYFTIEEILCKVSISSFFTPNGDGYNDTHYMAFLELFPDFEFEVFNKWGQRVFFQKSVYVPWDGTWKGIKVPDGVYYYIFFYDSENKKKYQKGDITILR